VIFAAISSGSFQNCGLDTDGTIACWGSTKDGEDNPTSGRFVDIGMGTTHGCARSEDGGIACWGNNEQGQQEIPD
jgi:alpha-tubulin suppressor-like RCC1 family protein